MTQFKEFWRRQKHDETRVAACLSVSVTMENEYLIFFYLFLEQGKFSFNRDAQAMCKRKNKSIFSWIAIDVIILSKKSRQFEARRIL